MNLFCVGQDTSSLLLGGISASWQTHLSGSKVYPCSSGCSLIKDEHEIDNEVDLKYYSVY